MKTMELYRDGEKVRDQIFADASNAKQITARWIADILPLTHKHNFYIKICDSVQSEDRVGDFITKKSKENDR